MFSRAAWNGVTRRAFVIGRNRELLGLARAADRQNIKYQSSVCAQYLWFAYIAECSTSVKITSARNQKVAQNLSIGPTAGAIY